MSTLRNLGILLVCLFVFLTQCESVSVKETANETWSLPKGKYKILGIFPHMGKSHFVMFQSILVELARRQHDVTVISHFPKPKTIEHLSNYKGINLNKGGPGINIVDLRQVVQSPVSQFFEMSMIGNWGLDNCEIMLNNAQVKKLIKNQNDTFDLILIEIFNSDCALGFVHKYKAPFISLSSHQLMPQAYHYLGNPMNPSYTPSIFMGHSQKMTFLQRLSNVFNYFVSLTYYRHVIVPPTQKLLQNSFGTDVPPLEEIARNTSALIVNTHHAIHGAASLLPNIVEVGGIHISDPQHLPRDIAKFLDEAHEGVLYFSWGSMVKASTMSPETLRMILNVIRSIPRKVIWKWEQDDLPGKPANLMVKKWLPQVDILAHPNVKCYLAHGGLLGLSEGVHAGVPLIVVPFFGDQFHNAAAVASRGIATVINFKDLTEDNLRAAVDKAFNDTSFMANAKAASKAFKDRPMPPMETAVWWVEHVASGNGKGFIQSQFIDLPWYQYLLLDVILFVAIVSLLFIYLLYKLIATVIGVCTDSDSQMGNDDLKKVKKL